MPTNVILSKEAFLQQYVLNRANTQTNSHGLSGDGCAGEAIKAWETIEKEMLKSPPSLPPRSWRTRYSND